MMRKGELEAISWPAALTSLITELRTHPGRIALLRQTAETDSTLSLMSDVLGEEPLSVGCALTVGDVQPSLAAIIDLLSDATLLVDVDILFWADLSVDPIALLAGLSRRRPRIAVWPGQISGDRTIYSEPGRRDYFAQQLVDAIVLTPMRAVYPDETPYTIERILA